MPRILLVEDSPVQAKMIRFVLEAAGFGVETAGSAEEGFKRLESEEFELVFTDLMLPGADGIDLCRRINADASLRRIPVVLLTGVDDETVALRALQEGAQDYLVKGQVNDKWIARSARYAIERKERAPETPPSGREAKTKASHLKVVYSDDIAVARITEKRLVGGGMAEQVGQDLFRLVEVAGWRKVLVDLSNVEYLSNAAMGALLSLHKRLQSVRGQLRLCGMRPEVQDNVTSRRLDKVFEIHELEESALDAF